MTVELQHLPFMLRTEPSNDVREAVYLCVKPERQ